MRIIDANDLRFEVIREAGTNKTTATVLAKRLGGILVQDQRDGGFLICRQILEADFDEIEEEPAAEADS